MTTVSTKITESKKDDIDEQVDYPDESRSEWLREAIDLRLAVENDREVLDELEGGHIEL